MGDYLSYLHPLLLSIKTTRSSETRKTNFIHFIRHNNYHNHVIYQKARFPLKGCFGTLLDPGLYLRDVHHSVVMIHQ